jgi:hypothetical protein
MMCTSRGGLRTDGAASDPARGKYLRLAAKRRFWVEPQPAKERVETWAGPVSEVDSDSGAQPKNKPEQKRGQYKYNSPERATLYHENWPWQFHCCSSSLCVTSLELGFRAARVFGRVLFCLADVQGGDRMEEDHHDDDGR